MKATLKHLCLFILHSSFCFCAIAQGTADNQPLDPRVNSAGAPVGKHYTLNNPGAAGAVQLFIQPEHVTHAQISFGDSYDAGQHLTQVVLDWYDDGVTDDFYWMGTLTSTFNQ